MLKDTVKTYVKSYALVLLWPIVVSVGILLGVGAFSSAPRAVKFGAAVPGQPNYNYNYIRNDAAAGYIYVANGEGGTTLSNTIGNIDSGIPAVNIGGDCTGASNNVICKKVSTDAAYPIHPATVDWSANGNPCIISETTVCSPNAADAGKCVGPAIPSGCIVDVDYTFDCMQSDGGKNGGGEKGFCRELNTAGTCSSLVVCGTTAPWVATDSGVADAYAAAPTMAITSCVPTMTPVVSSKFGIFNCALTTQLTGSKAGH
jgi:hypothetical protein